MRILLLLLALTSFACPSAYAGFVELGASANFRYEGYDSANYVETLAYTASVSYYFWEMCAWELNYTNGYSKQVTKGPLAIDDKETVEDNIELTSLDLVLSLADRQAAWRPYVKFGGGYLKKDRYFRVNSDDETLIVHQEGLVPSAGLGMSLNITSAFSIKIGIDAWTTPVNYQPMIVDYVGRAGVSWIF